MILLSNLLVDFVDMITFLNDGGTFNFRLLERLREARWYEDFRFALLRVVTIQRLSMYILAT